MTAAKQLSVLLGGAQMGTLTEAGGRYTFSYDAAYLRDPAGTPLSLSMPLGGTEYGDQVVRAFLAGLLPDNEAVLDRWAREFHVSARNPFALLRHVGADCAGAVQFAEPDVADALLAGKGAIEWVDDREISRRLKRLHRDPYAWHASTTGQFSLAGAQAKTALYFDPRSRRWGDPSGAIPTTDIIKPAVVGLDDHDLNEHICLRAAGALGIDTAKSTIMSFVDERAVVLSRYDRLRGRDGSVLRVHQEDMCQALGLPPDRKYQNEGGPSPVQIANLLRTWVGAGAVLQFVDALAFNWIIAGTDAHAKNYSVLLSGAQVRLAPLYDVASALPYDDIYLPKLKMAMSIGREYTLSRIGQKHWRRLAGEVGVDPDNVVDRIATIVANVPDAFMDACGSAPVKALHSRMPGRLVDRVGERARQCADALAWQPG